ncbi:MAG: 30S ribosome-binding factor RbfA [Bacteroidales bacterium]|nr:30S ribosome-binding factor RbfA [Bacteroidales bacterium]
MEKTRLKKVERLLQKELGTIFQRNTFSEQKNVLVSVTVIRVSTDLSVARIYLSVFPSSNAEEVLKNIIENTGKIKYELGTKVRNQLRKIPDLKFFIDDSLDYANKIDELLK